MNKLNLIFTSVFALLTVFESKATIITLEDNDIRNTGIYQESNFTISAPINLVNGGNLPERTHLAEVGFSGDYMETWNTTAVFNLEESSGKEFDFIGLDVGSYFSKNNGLAAWTFTGFNGDKEVFSLVNSTFLGRLTFNWVELTRVSISSFSAPAASSFDNIEVSISTPAPMVASVSEPNPVTLFMVSLLVALTFKRKKIAK
jgi:hypothetical protein